MSIKYWTLFKGVEQVCDPDGNPLRFNTYEEAEEYAEELSFKVTITPQYDD